MCKKIIICLLAITTFTTLYAQQGEDPFPKFQIAASGGYAFRLGKKPASSDYYKDISRGSVLDGGLYYYFSRQSGMGIRYSEFSSFGSGNLITGQFARSDIKIRFIGPVYQSRLISRSEKFHFLTGLSLGYMSYRDNAVFDQGSAAIKGGTFGTMVELGSDLRIVRGLFAGLKFSLYGGSLSSITRQGQTVQLDDKQRESLSRIEGTVGLRYYPF
ncbi:hypothetical protein [Niabella drilacis]|uniref:Outer membrane protein beta-barrel domain-containing protein n=1 Tax=Niabella drilacis (strain DSM 25811 / CCM 8410 / CCUG 62505 / LMG 26954 / E90) TaxID=1285928 RepID=A0A1G7ATK7_NIADE|nr:hypothetical protein [Niabella drilacis]SDE18169.1 hypothetical protein SAMN04487894_12516 [Niabella drilacis]